MPEVARESKKGIEPIGGPPENGRRRIVKKRRGKILS